MSLDDVRAPGAVCGDHGWRARASQRCFLLLCASVSPPRSAIQGITKDVTQPCGLWLRPCGGPVSDVVPRLAGPAGVLPCTIGTQEASCRRGLQVWFVSLAFLVRLGGPGVQPDTVTALCSGSQPSQNEPQPTVCRCACLWPPPGPKPRGPLQTYFCCLDLDLCTHLRSV